MKKLIAFVAIVAAVAAHGATVTWASGGIGLPPNGTGTANNAVTAALYVLDASSYSALTAAVAGKSAADVSTYIYEQYKGQAATVTSTTWSKGANTLKDTTVYSSGDTAYAVVLYTATVGDSEYYIGNYASWTFPSGSNKTVGSMGLKLNSDGAALAWATPSASSSSSSSSGGDSGVPEPTGGLLLAVGAGVLALRRKRA